MNKILLATITACGLFALSTVSQADTKVETETKSSTSGTIITPSTDVEKRTKETVEMDDGEVESREKTTETHSSDGMSEKHEVTKEETDYDD